MIGMMSDIGVNADKVEKHHTMLIGIKPVKFLKMFKKKSQVW